MRNCKEGDLATIVKDFGKMENLGLIVRVIRAHGDDGWIEENGNSILLFSWVVEVLSDTSQIIYSDIEGNFYGEKVGEVPDAYLRPLPKLIDDESLEACGLTPLQYDLAVGVVKESLRIEESGS
jgi:hypothetical protein